MNFYSLFYKLLISKLPDKWIEKGGGPFFGLRSHLWFRKTITLPFSIGEHKFLNPTGMPAGWIDTPNKERIIRRFGVGIAVIKTITVDAKKGNPYPRIIRKGDDLINSMGLPNKGVDWWATNYQPKDHPTMISIKGNNLTEWEVLIEKLEDKADIFELNLSCPNVSDGIMDLGSSEKLIKDIASMTTKDIFVKLSPEYSGNQNLQLIDKIRSSVSGISLINTVPVENKRLGNPQHIGGLSGASIYDTLIDQLKVIRSKYPLFDDLPIFAMGGISSPEKAWAVIEQFKSIPLTLTTFLTKGPIIYHNFLTHIKNNIENSYNNLMDVLNWEE